MANEEPTTHGGAAPRDDAPVLVIPAFRPGADLPGLLARLDGRWEGPVLVVDDGSGEAYRATFDDARALGAVVVTHAANLGKGRALKTAFNECLVRWPQSPGCVTADADGQHGPDDILACAAALEGHPGSLVMGCRDFSAGNVPFRSRLGNRAACAALRFLCGVAVTDTQTGLRAVPAAFMRDLLAVPGERFDFETNMLLQTKRDGVPVREVPIATIYAAEGHTSHYATVRDTLRILALLLKFALSSIAGTVVDVALFALLDGAFKGAGWGISAVALATVLARAVSAAVNFGLNRSVVFKSRSALGPEAVRYAALCLAVVAVSALLVTVLSLVTGLEPVVLKVPVDTALFFVNYQVQRLWVFAPAGEGRGR